MNTKNLSALWWLVPVVLSGSMASGNAHSALVQGSAVLQDVTYTTYQEPGQTAYRIVCQTPCPIPIATLQAASDGFAASRQQLVALAGIDTLAALRPVDVAYEANALCPAMPPAAGYSSIYWPSGIGFPNPQRVRLCLFLWDKQQSGLIDYFTPQSAQLPSSQLLAMHEYSHGVFFNRSRWSLEDFAFYWSFVVSGIFNMPDGMCSTVLESYNVAPLLVGLCRDYGATDADIRAALQQLDGLYQSDLGYHGGPTSLAQMRASIDARLGVDTSPLFQEIGYAPQQIGRRLAGTMTSLGAGSVYRYNTGFADRSFWLKGFALYNVSRLKLEYPTCLASAPFLDFSLAFDLVHEDHREYENILSDPTFVLSTEITYSFAHWTAPAGVHARNLRVYRMPAHCGTTSVHWEQIPDDQVVFDHENRSVSFTATRGGTYALMQPDAIFAGGFQ